MPFIASNGLTEAGSSRTIQVGGEAGGMTVHYHDVGRERNRIRVTRIRRPLRRKVRHTRRVRSKPAHALREAIADEGSAASHVLPRWR